MSTGTPSSMRGRWPATREMAWRPSQPTVRVGWNLDGTVGCVGEDAGGGAVRCLDEAGGLPAHAESEAGEASGFCGEEVEEVPLGHECDEFGVGGKVGEIGHLKACAADDGGETGDL